MEIVATPYGEIMASGQRFYTPTMDAFDPPDYNGVPLDSGTGLMIQQGAPNSNGAAAQAAPPWWDIRTHPALVIVLALVIGMLALRYIHYE